jgi:hypothetical protein
MTRSRRLAAGLCLCVGAAALPGASALGARAASTASFRTAYAPLNTSLNRLAAKVRGTFRAIAGESDATIAAQFRAMSATGNGLTADIRALPGAPAALKPLQARLAAALGTVSRDLGAIRNAAADHDVAAARAAVTKLAGAIPPLAAAQAALDRRLGLPAS